VDVGTAAQPLVLLGPDVDHAPNVGARHVREGEIVSRGKADDAAGTRLAARDQQVVLEVDLRRGLARLARAQGSEVVLEDERAGVRGIADAARAFVPRAEVAGGVVGRTVLWRPSLDLALPRALRTMRGDEHPFPGER